MKILVIQQKMIGDVLLSSILCELLKTKYPNSQLDYVINSNTIDVITGNPFIDNVIEFSSKKKNTKQYLFKFISHLRANKYDLVVDAYGKLESNLMSAFSGAKKRISYYKYYTFFCYSSTIQRKPIVITNAGNALENRLRLLVNEDQIASNIIRPKIYLSDQESLIAKEYLEQNNLTNDKKLIMISVLGSSKNKTLPLAYMAKLIDEIVGQTNANILFNYIPSQFKEAEQVYNLTKDITKKSIHLNVFGKNLRSFLGILSHCTMLIGNEGGAVNMAKALGVDTFTVFSPWIKKEDWNMFEDGETNVSVHLNDFKPKYYLGIKEHKILKKDSLKLYKEFTPDLIIPRLREYLKNK